MSHHRHLWPALLGLLILTACAQHRAAAPVVDNPLLGAWQVRSVHWHSAEKTHTIDAAQPGVFLFTERGYSIMWTPTREPRVPFAVLSKPTDAEMMAGFKSVVFNGGSYQLNPATRELTTTAQVAKVPGFEGGLQHYSYRFDGEVLHLTMVDETYPDGSKPEWSGVWQTEFVLTPMR